MNEITVQLKDEIYSELYRLKHDQETEKALENPIIS